MIEQSLLHVLLNHNDAIVDIDVTGQEFENANYAFLFGEIKTMLNNREVVDVITLSAKLERETGRDWLALITDLAVNSAGVKDNVKAYCEAIKKDNLHRQAISIGKWLIDNSKESGSTNEAIKKLMELGKGEQKHEYSIEEAMKIGVESLNRAFESGGSMVGLPTGIKSLDEALGGLHDSDLVMVGARPAMGKTAVLLNFMSNAGHSIGMISGEQGVGQIIQRYWAIKSNVSVMSMRNGSLTEDDFTRINAGGVKIKQGHKIRFYDKPSPSIDDIENIARRWKFEFGIKALYVDYLQKIKRDPKKQKAEAVGDNVARLKNLARELEIPVICLAQVSRAVEARNDSRPGMGDLSDSSEIEKEADQIIMLYRDEVYNPDTVDKGVMELLIEKNRHGSTGRVCASWDGRYLKVGNMHEPQYSQH